MRKFFGLVVLILASLSLFTGKVSAESALKYPIVELGYCRDAKECFLYCEIPANKAACWSYGAYKLGPQVLGTTTLTPEEKTAMEAKAKGLGITFPIAELGNCAGPQECRDFCEQPSNQTTCVNFAKTHGIDRGNGGDQKKEQEMLSAAQSELGCTTKESCFRICEQDHTKCEAFMQRHGISEQSPQSTGPSTTDKAKLLEDAKSQLGCMSTETCSQACQQNPQRCAEFAKQHGVGGEGTEPRPSGSQGKYQQGQYGGASGGSKGPGGCDNEASCKAYCQSHPSECQGFQGAGQRNGPTGISSGSGSYVGPSGCRTQEECASYCKANPSACPGFPQGNHQNQPNINSSPAPKPSGMYPSGSPQQYEGNLSPPPQQQYPSGSYPAQPSGGFSPPPGSSYPTDGSRPPAGTFQ